MGFSLALASALLLAVRRIYEKQLTARFGNFSLSFILTSFALIPTLVLFLFFPIPQNIFALPWHFWWPLFIIWIVLYPLQNYLLYRSLREGELSEVAPVSALLPVFNIATSFIGIGELPSAFGFAGILATAVGVYVLLSERSGGRNYNKPVLFMAGSVLCTA